MPEERNRDAKKGEEWKWVGGAEVLLGVNGPL